MTVARNTILIYMETEPFAQSLKKAFDASGYQSMIVTTESAAYAAARASLPSLIIIDRQQRTLANLRQLQTLVAVPIVAVQEGTSPCSEDDCIRDYDKASISSSAVKVLVNSSRACAPSCGGVSLAWNRRRTIVPARFAWTWTATK